MHKKKYIKGDFYIIHIGGKMGKRGQPKILARKLTRGLSPGMIRDWSGTYFRG